MLWWLFGLGCVEATVGIAPHCVGTEQHMVPTADGAVVHLHRHPAEGPPVLIVHGISSNHHCWDLTAQRSLGVYLAEAGLDAWLLDLRGHGDAQRDIYGKPQRAGWTIDDYARQDLPAAVERILQQTGQEKVAYVGHSLGGMVGGIYAAEGGSEKLSSFVAVGTPMDFTDPDPLMKVGFEAGSTAGMVWPVLPAQLGALVQSYLPGAPSEDSQHLFPIDAMLFRDLDAEHRELMYQRVVSHVSAGEVKQLSEVGTHGTLYDAEGKQSHLEAFKRIQVPALVIAGRGDLVAPVDRVYATYEALGSSDKRFVVAGRSTGFSADYGHLDLTLGNHVVQEIFPLILERVRP